MFFYGDKTNVLEKSGVYQINCSCGSFHIGQTGRKLEIRIKGHKKSILDKKRCTGLSTHCIDKNHVPDFDNVKLIKTCNKRKKITLLRKIYYY